MHVLLIYGKWLKNNFERVHFLVKFSSFSLFSRWSWVVAAKLWLIVGGRGWWWQNFGWLLVVVAGGGKIMADREWSWMVAQFSNAHSL